MATSQLHDPTRMAHGHHQDLQPRACILPYQTGKSAKERTNKIRDEIRAAPSLDPFPFYKTHTNINVPLLGDQDYFESDDDGHTCYPGATAAQDAPVDGAQPAKGHTVAYGPPVRLANRPNGAPLATIIEQGSFSTLTSHGSLLSAGCLPSTIVRENTSPTQGPRWVPLSPDEKALHDIRGNLTRENEELRVAVSPTMMNKEYRATDPAIGTATPLTSYRFELQQCPSSHFGTELLDHNNRGAKGFIRGVVQSMRGVAGTRSRSSTTMHAPITEQTSGCKQDPQVDRQGQDSDSAYLPKNNRNTYLCPSEVAAFSHTHAYQARNGAISSPGVELSAHAHSSLVQLRPDATDSADLIGSSPPALPCRAATRSHEQPTLTPVVHAGTRDVARRECTGQASTSHHDIFDTSARYTFDGVPAHRGNPTSLRETDNAEVFTSQNASFCSTMSTSYSGTVLGVDLDLQHDITYPMRHSQSPSMNAWFTPQLAELERQASFSESPESVKTFDPSHAPSRSITSSALTSLLPIAAASGIVRPNYSTPKISFYSPSGNLIQSESDIVEPSCLSKCEGSPTTNITHYHREIVNAPSSSATLPIQSNLIATATSTAYRSPLPLHLQHHHKYLQSEVSQISSRESFIQPKGTVKGCHGVMREDSLSPRSGVFYPPRKNKAERSTKLMMHDLKADAKFYKARFLSLAAAQSFTPTLPKGRTLQPRHVHNYNAYTSKCHTAKTEGTREEDVLAPLAAHALRVCFCQPYDGAGISTRSTSLGACIASKFLVTKDKLKTDTNTDNVEGSLPNSRIVSGGSRREGAKPKRAVSSTKQHLPDTRHAKR